jgi:hypothetical protein
MGDSLFFRFENLNYLSKKYFGTKLGSLLSLIIKSKKGGLQ